MDPAEIQKLITAKRQELGQRQAEAADINNKFSPATDSTVSALRSNHADKVKQLFDYDSKVAQTTFTPQYAGGPSTGNVQMPTQGIMDPTIGMKASSYQTQQIAGEVADLITQISQRKDYLSSERDKALSVLDKVLKINQLETDSLQQQLENYYREREDQRAEQKSKRDSSGSDSLTNLFNTITGFQQKNIATQPQAMGVTKANPFDLYRYSTKDPKTGLLKPNLTKKSKGQLIAGPHYKALINELNKYPGAEFDFQSNPDGSYTYSVRKTEQEFLGSEKEAEIYKNPVETIKKLGAATVATDPKMSTEVNALIKNLLPEQSTYQQPGERSLDLQSAINEEQAFIDSMRNNGESENNIQLYIKEAVQRNPNLKGYIK